MNIKARAKDVVKYEAFGDAGGVIEELVSQLEKVEAERDAALAAIERCRGVIASWRSVQASNREYFESGNPGMIVPIDFVGGLGAALDGAPEPEWEYGYTDHGMNPMNGCQDFDTARACAQGMQEKVVRRRPAGPWLPVEGESKS